MPARNLNMLVGTIAELTKNKGLEYLIEAIAELHQQLQTTPSSPSEAWRANYQLKTIIIGDGEERKKLEALIQQRGLENAVHLIGFMPNAAQYLKAFDLFVLSSLKEGLPYTILEAMHAGVPVVGSRVGGIPDLVEQEGTGIIVPPKTPIALSNAIKQLLDDKALRQKFGKQAQRRAQEKFSFDAMIAATVRLYNGM